MAEILLINNFSGKCFSLLLCPLLIYLRNFKSLQKPRPKHSNFRWFITYWSRVDYENAEPTNNAAERSLRYGVTWRKLSYGSQSEIGERFVERVMTVAMTLKLRAKNTFEYFTECFKEFIQGRHSPPVFST